jgi:hypothetical protein
MWDELGRLCAIHNKEVGTSPANQKKMNCRLRCDKLAFFKTNENAANPQAPQSCFACPSAHSVAQGIVHEFHWEQSMKQEVFKSRKGQPQIMWVK